MLMLPCLPVTIRPLINRGPAKKALHWDAEGEAADAYIMLCDSNSIYSLFCQRTAQLQNTHAEAGRNKNALCTGCHVLVQFCALLPCLLCNKTLLQGGSVVDTF